MEALHIHKDMLQTQCNVVTELVMSAKRKHHTDWITEPKTTFPDCTMPAEN